MRALVTEAGGSDGTIRLERRGAVAWLTIDRPAARNALTFAMYEALRTHCAALADDESARAVVISGAGNAFAAGTDIAEFRAFRGADDGLAYERRMETVLGALEAVPVPTFAAVRGACTGGGASIAAACDLRIGAPSARVGVPIARTLGNCLSLRNDARLAALVGEAAAKHLLFTGELVDARRAYELGFFNELVADEAALEARVTSLAELVAANAPLTLRVTKEAFRRLRAHGAGAPDDDLIAACYGSDDFREGMTAFLDKRPAAWSGR